MEPINYKLDVLNPFQVATSGMQAGFGAINNINALQDRQAQIEAQKQAQAAALQQQQLRNQVLQAHIANPSYETATQIAALYPKEQAEQINKVFTAWDENKQKNVSTNLMNIQAGLDSDKPEVGIDLLNKYEESLKNSGADPMQLEFVNGLKQIAEEKGPRAASFALTGPLAHAVGMDKYTQYRKGIEEARLVQGQDKREQQKVDIEGAYKKGLLEVNRLEAKIKAQQVAIERFKAQTERMNAGTAKDANLIKLKELEMSLQDKLDAKAKIQRENQSAAENAMSGFDSTIDTALKLRDHPGFNSLFGVNLVPGTNAFIPGTEAAGAKTIFEQLQSKGFLAEIEKMKGLGALSENEGKKLGAAVVALDPSMPEKDAKVALNEIIKTMSIAKERAAKKYGVKPSAPVSTGVKPNVSGW